MASEQKEERTGGEEHGGQSGRSAQQKEKLSKCENTEKHSKKEDSEKFSKREDTEKKYSKREDLNKSGEVNPDPWDRFSKWIHCICIVTFDLELGQAIEVCCKNKIN